MYKHKITPFDNNGERKQVELKTEVEQYEP